MVVYTNMLLQMAFVKFLYTNVWYNVGSSYDEFWEQFLWVTDLFHTAWVCALIPFIGYFKSDDLSVCLGIHPACQRHIVQPSIFPDWINPDSYMMLIFSIILFFSWHSQKTKQRLNSHFVQRFGLNSKFGQEHVGVAQNKLVRILVAIGVVLIAGEFYVKIAVSPEDYNRVPGSTFHIMREVILSFYCYVIASSAFIIQDKKQKAGLLRALNKYWDPKLRGFPFYKPIV